MAENLFQHSVLKMTHSMYRYALSIVKEEETAKDVVQECLAKIWKKRNQLQELNHLEAWVMRTVRNQSFDALDTRKFDDLDSKVVQMNSLSETLEDKIILEEQMKFIEKVVEHLPTKLKEVFQLRDIEGLDYITIGKICDMTQSDVKVSIHRARKRIKEQLIKTEAYGKVN